MNKINPIVEWRGRKAMTQLTLANKLGVHLNAVKNWEHSRNKPSHMIRKRLTAVIGVSSDELYLALEEGRPFKEKADGS